MSAFYVMNKSMQCTEPERDYIAPRMKLRNEVLFVLIDGKWVNYCQSPFVSSWKPFVKKTQNKWSIEENRALWEENQVLQTENRMLWQENKALQCLQSQSKAIQVIYTDAIQSLQKQKKPFPFFQERNIGFQVTPGNKDLQVVQEKNRVLEDFQQENKAVSIIWKDQKTITVHEEGKDASSDLQKDTDILDCIKRSIASRSREDEKRAVSLRRFIDNGNTSQHHHRYFCLSLEDLRTNIDAAEESGGPFLITASSMGPPGQTPSWCFYAGLSALDTCMAGDSAPVPPGFKLREEEQSGGMEFTIPPFFSSSLACIHKGCYETEDVISDSGGKRTTALLLCKPSSWRWHSEILCHLQDDETQDVSADL
ncbi:LOW QUALITY PROTEIN: protein chibby homolog 2 [Chlamydotis macqueenii]